MALSFNGTSSKLVWAGQIHTGYPYSEFGWIKPTSTGASGMVLGCGDVGADNELMIYADGAGSGSKVKAFAREASSAAAESTTALQSTWQPALAVFESASSRKIYYANGAVVTETTVVSPNWANFDRFVVGTRGISDTLWFAGDIAEVAVWGAALTQGNFNSLAAGDVPSSVASGSLIDYWSLLTQAATHTGSGGRVLTATNTSQAGSHPIAGGGPSGGGPLTGGLTRPILTKGRLLA